MIVKTTDDGAKLSYPDPNRAMERLFALYDGFVRPNTEHTRFTDRYNGRKCLAYLNHAGLVDVRVRTFTIDTTGKTLDERRALFERCVYFRRNVPACVDPATADEVHRLVDEWGALFDREDYYYCNVTFVALARKPIEGGGSFEYAGSVFGDAASYGAESSEGEGFRIRRMREDDIGAVMGIQMASFDDPWTPFAFALELRHNPRARYMVATDGCGNVVGYVGWWEMDEYATISQIATAPSARRQGIAHSLLSRVLASSAAAGCGSVQLEVRSRNDGARSFYRAEGFVQADVRPGYYQAPEDDAVILVRECRA